MGPWENRLEGGWGQQAGDEKLDKTFRNWEQWTQHWGKKSRNGVSSRWA